MPNVLTCQELFCGVSLKSLVLQFRKEKRLTQAKLGALLGMSEASVNNWERGKNRPTPAALAKMADLAEPKLAEKLRDALAAYQWHPGSHAHTAEEFDSALDSGKREEIRRMASKAKIPVAEMYAFLIESGLKQYQKQPVTSAVVSSYKEIEEDIAHGHGQRKHRKKAG